MNFTPVMMSVNAKEVFNTFVFIILLANPKTQLVLQENGMKIFYLTTLVRTKVCIEQVFCLTIHIFVFVEE